jgi:dihydrofolate synthase/folylpolyglutamate synthase
MVGKTIRSFEQAQTALRKFYGKHAEGPYTLDRMRALLRCLDNPQDKLRIVHVAGTSGKTSTSYFTASLLAQSGAKVGLTVSPHVDALNERVQINCVPLGEETFCGELTEFLRLVEASGILPSYFEFMIAFAFWEFVRQKVDYAVVEVGLGGRLDGTNVVSRIDKVCVITDIGLDHTEVLGDTLEAIAAQKAGIIQPGNHVFVYEQEPEIDEVIKQAAEDMRAELHHISTNHYDAPETLPLFQQRNFNLALQTVRYVLQSHSRPAITPEHAKIAAEVYIPARMEILQVGDKTVIVDGSHNAQKLHTLFTAIGERYSNEPVAALVGFVQGDNYRLHQSLQILTDNCEHLIVTSFDSDKDQPKRSVASDQVIIQCHELGYNDIEAVVDPRLALEALKARPEKILLVAGSFYLLNHVRPYLQILNHSK